MQRRDTNRDKEDPSIHRPRAHILYYPMGQAQPIDVDPEITKTNPFHLDINTSSRESSGTSRGTNKFKSHPNWLSQNPKRPKNKWVQ